MEGDSTLPRKCEFCQRSFKDPKVLPCFHILCRECIRSLQVKGVEQLKCPVNRCTKKFTCKENDPESLPDATIVYHLQDLQKFKQKLKRNELICDSCFDKDRKKISAVASCDHCNHICQTCKKLHTSEDEFSDHDVVQFLDLSNQFNDSLHTEILKRSRTMSFVQQTRNKCRVHHEPNVSFCLDCKTYVCSKCTDITHAKHKYKVASNAFTECKELLKQHIPSVMLKRNYIIEAVGYIEQRKDDVTNQKLSLSSSVDATFERLARILDKRKQELKKRLDHLTERKLTNLAAQQLELERAASEIERMVDFTEKVLDSSTERELLTLYPFLDESIKRSSKAISRPGLQPVEQANTTFKVSAINHLKEVCHRDLEVYSEQANPGTCSAEGEGLKSAQTLHYSQFTVNVVDRNRKPCPSIQDVVVKVKSCENEFESSALVHNRGSGRYRVSFCPEFCGPHEIAVTVNGRAIPGSPFPLVVHMPREQLGSPRGSIHDVTQPRGIVVRPDNGRILVCEWNGNGVVEMDRIGRNRHLIRGGAGGSGIIHPASIALSPTSSSAPFTSSGDIFVVEGAGSMAGVIKWNREGKTLKSVCGEGTNIKQFKSPRGIKIGGANNHLYVCDRDNHRIQVFDLDLNFLRCIQLQDFGYKFAYRPKPNDIAFDQDGNMFITDLANNCIHRLTSSEEYVMTFSESLEGGLMGPECVAVDTSGFLYVTESKSHRVSVFRTSGECVKVFGSKGKGEGEFNFPMGVAVDEYGGVFVCELLNNRIQVF